MEVSSFDEGTIPKHRVDVHRSLPFWSRTWLCQMTDSPTSESRRSLLRTLSNPGSGANQVRSLPDRIPPAAGDTVRLSTRAMACDFSVIMNPGMTSQIEAAGEALNGIHAIEDWLSTYRSSSELSTVNRLAADQRVTVRGDLFELLLLARELHERTNGAFDLSCGALTQLWRNCRQQQRIPDQSEIDAALQKSGMSLVDFDKSRNQISFSRRGLILDPGAIGKGYALDESCRVLQESEFGPQSFLIHGGHSSLKAIGGHNGHAGWPVGIGNPLFTEKRLGTLLLCDRAMATSGSNIQFFRHEGKRYGHILHPQTAWPIEGMLSVTVLAPSAAVADALSTAFFVMGVEKAVACCENWPEIGAILIPFPVQGRKVHPTVVGLAEDMIVWDHSQVELMSS